MDREPPRGQLAVVSFQLRMKVRIALVNVRRGEREQDPAERLPLGAAVDHGGFLEVERQGLHKGVRFQTVSVIDRLVRSSPGRC